MELDKLTNVGVAQKTIVYGATKSGKTRMIARLAKTRKLLWFDTENGSATLLDAENLAPEFRKNINLVRLPDTVEEPLAARALNSIFSFKETSICHKHGVVSCPTCKKAGAPFDVVNLRNLEPGTIVVVDSLSQLVNSWTASIAAGKPDTYKFQFDDWALLGVYGKKFLTNIQSIPIDVIVTSREIEVVLEDGSKKLVPNGGTRNFSCDVAGFFDHAIYTGMLGKRHTQGSSTTYTSSAITGSRTNVATERSDEKINYSPLELIYPPLAPTGATK